MIIQCVSKGSKPSKLLGGTSMHNCVCTEIVYWYIYRQLGSTQHVTLK